MYKVTKLHLSRNSIICFERSVSPAAQAGHPNEKAAKHGSLLTQVLTPFLHKLLCCCAGNIAAKQARVQPYQILISILLLQTCSQGAFQFELLNR